jgi:hypothetical protein
MRPVGDITEKTIALLAALSAPPTTHGPWATMGTGGCARLSEVRLGCRLRAVLPGFSRVWTAYSQLAGRWSWIFMNKHQALWPWLLAVRWLHSAHCTLHWLLAAVRCALRTTSHLACRGVLAS